jgi:hypothetical protein
MKKVERKAVVFAGNHREELLDELVERAKPYVRESLARWLDQTLSKDTSTHPFHLAFKEFAKFSEEEQRAWRHQVLDLEEEWLAEQLAKRKAEWILVVGGKIIKASSKLEELPSKKEIYRIAKARGFAPLLFIKDFLIEESGTTWGSSSWSRISSNDYYPTITFYIGSYFTWQESRCRF